MASPEHPCVLRRSSGVLVPLFSMPSTSSWGIGEIGDLPHLAGWLRSAGQSFVQLLPVNEMAPGQTSPYSALSAMAIDPIYISLGRVPDFQAAGGEEALSPSIAATLGAARHAARIDYSAVRRVKEPCFLASFERFKDAEWVRDTPRAAALRAFVESERWWLEDYALFRAIHAREGERPWTTWPAELKRREPRALERAARELEEQVLMHSYLQWLAHEAWQDTRGAIRPLALFGDLPFMVDLDSADVWANQALFDLDGSIGVPPDAFSATGQNWGMPAYRWEEMARADYAWLRQRARRSADLYDGYRIDHLVGFYRTYVFPAGGSKAYFTPEGQDEQTALGERLMKVFSEAGASVIAEDLGTVPDFVRASLGRLGIPGYKVLRWERHWKDVENGQPFRDPLTWPPDSVATSGTHDTEPLAVWWNQAEQDERAGVLKIPFVAQRLGSDPTLVGRPFDPALRDVLLELLFASGSKFLILPIQDIFGWTDRVNVPARVDGDNWTYRLPWPVDRLAAQPEARERAATLRRWARQYRRMGN
ncbi:MAG: 4-alpha-glucanotransferase [Vicinamibacterales bacterium]